MSARKQTPDVLGDILGGATNADAEAIDMVGVEPVKPAPKPRKPRTARTGASKAAPAVAAPTVSAPDPAPVVAVEWEYREVVFRDYRGWRVRAVNGREARNWKEAQTLLEYVTQAGAEGWEMVNITNPHHGEKTAYFKRIKPAP